MRPGLVEILPPNTDDVFGVVGRVKLSDAEVLVRVPAVERFDEPVSLGLTWRNKHQVHFDCPSAKGYRDEYSEWTLARYPSGRPSANLLCQSPSLFGAKSAGQTATIRESLIA